MSAQIHKLLEGRIDFYGQDAVDRWARIVLVLATVISFLAGFVTESQKLTIAIFGGTLTAVLLLAIPPWPYLKRHPVSWSRKVGGKRNETK